MNKTKKKHSLAKQGTVLEDLVKIVHVPTRVEIFSCYQRDPFQALLGVLLAVLAINLQIKNNKKISVQLFAQQLSCAGKQISIST